MHRVRVGLLNQLLNLLKNGEPLCFSLRSRPNLRQKKGDELFFNTLERFVLLHPGKFSFGLLSNLSLLLGIGEELDACTLDFKLGGLGLCECALGLNRQV